KSMMARRCPWAGLALIVWAGSIFVHASSSPAGQRALPSPGATVSRTYGAYWEVGNGRSSSLLLRNQDRQSAVTGNLTVYGADGQTAQIVPLQLAANSVTRISLAELIKPSGELQWGGLALEFAGAAAHVQGDVTFQNLLNGSRTTLRLQGGLAFDNENALHAPWWLPDSGTDGRITLFNSSGQTIVVSPSLTLAGQEQTAEKISLGPHQSRQLRLRELMQDTDVTAGSITLRYEGPAHALQPALLLENPSSGFALAPGFHARHRQASDAQTTWVFPNVVLTSPSDIASNPQSKLRSFAILTNGNSSPLQVQVNADFSVSGDHQPHRVALPVAELAPSETRVIDFSQLIASGYIPESVRQFAVSVAHVGSPGDLAITILSASEDKKIVVPSEGAILDSGSAQTSYWSVPAQSGMFPQVKNEGNATVSATFALLFATTDRVENVVLPTVSIAPNRGRKINIGEVLASSIPDENGRVAPAGVATGIIAVSSQRNRPPMAIPGGECPQECLPIGSAPRKVLASSIHFAGLAATAASAACTVPCTISVSRSSLTQTSSSGSPSGGSFSYSSAVVSGQLPASYTTGNATANPNTANIVAPKNPQSPPSPGGLAELTASYHCPTGDTDLHPFRVPTFGLSCYILADENDFLTATQTCKSLTISGTTYSGVTTNPPGLPAGDYCTSFLGDVRLQGSGSTRNGTKIHFLSGTNPTWQFSVVANFTGADGTA